MKARVWDALISKEESQMYGVRRQLDEMNEQHEHIRDRIEYIDSLLSEYATSSISSPLKLTRYQLQLLRMRDKLTEEKRFLKADLVETQQQLQSHNNEIRKFGKMRTRTVTQHHQREQRKENHLMDESGIMQFNLQRRTES
jgi:flagellar export protein FliJ